MMTVSFIQPQPPSENLPPIKPRASRLSAFPALTSIRELTLCQAKSIKTVSFISTPATIRELTLCQDKNIKTVRFNPAPATIRNILSFKPRALRLSASFQLQPPLEHLPPVKPRASRLSASFQLEPHERTYILLKHKYHSNMKIMRDSDTKTDFVTIMIHFVSTNFPIGL